MEHVHARVERAPSEATVASEHDEVDIRRVRESEHALVEGVAAPDLGVNVGDDGITGRVAKRVTPTTTLYRRAVGMVANAAVFVPVAFTMFYVVIVGGRVITKAVLPHHVVHEYKLTIYWLSCAVLFILWKVVGARLQRALKVAIGRSLSALGHALLIGAAGRGGSARFAGLLAEWAQAWKPGRVLLGASLYDPKHHVGVEDDRHILTIAASASGKGRSAIIPNLLTFPGSAVVIDPKGTNAAVTAAARGFGGGRVASGMGQAVHVFDPFGVVANLPGVPKSVRINPLADITPGSLTFYEDCDRLAESLVIPGKGGDSHWDNSARALIRGLIAHVVANDAAFGNLGHVREMLTQPGGPPLQAMLNNTRAGTLAREVAAQLLAASDREAASIVSTAIVHTDWLASEAMRDALSAAEFRFSMLKEQPTTLYAVLPPHYLKVHARALRVIVNAGIGAATKGGASNVPILFILDEFYSLGRMDTLMAAIANIRSYGVRLWPILQNLAQLEELYGRNWTSFWANTGQVQIFASNDKETQEHVAQVLGMSVLWDRDQEGNTVPVGRAMLRTPQEVAREVSRAGGRQIVFREGEDPFVLKRLNYDQVFPKTAFNPDPDHRDKPSRWDRMSGANAPQPAPARLPAPLEKKVKEKARAEPSKRRALPYSEPMLWQRFFRGDRGSGRDGDR